MTSEEIRLECLKLAREFAEPGEDILTAAARLAAFVMGS